jgi:hypothetical protein
VTVTLNVNEYFLRKLSRLNVPFRSEEFNLLSKRGKALTQLGIDSDKKILSYKLVKAAGRSLDLEVPDSVYRKAVDLGISNKNDAYLMLLENRIKERGIKKIAYPNPFGQNYDVEGEVDINKWLKTVHLIYDSVQKEEMTKEKALEYYSNFLDIEREEDTRFKKWFKYYSEGEHLKYSSDEEQDMKKSAVYMSNLGQAASTYSHGGGSSYVGSGNGFNMPGDSFDGSTFDEAAEMSKSNADESDAFGSWKGKLHGALRRIDKLLRSKHMNGEKYKLLAEHLLNLSHQVHCLKLASTISDVTYKTANTLERHGQADVAEMLIKLAQEVPPPAEAVLPEEAAMPGSTQAALPEEAAMPEEDLNPTEVAPDPNDPKSAIPSGDDVDPVELKDITPMPGARPGEYEELAGTISLDDAARKLDEVAGMLADRRIIRQLAEFDIMLDKIGIASMFPELAESQSKLIDSFSYALTRVTKMMGQLANAKSISESRSDLPGKRESEGEPSGAEAPQSELPQEPEVGPES